MSGLARFSTFVLVCLVTFSVAVAAQSQTARPFPPIALPDGVITIDAMSVRVDSDFQPTFTPPNVEHLVPVSPEAALRAWADQRLEATGTGAGVVVVTVTEASITEKPLKVTEGIKGWFRKDQAAEYRATLAATIELETAAGKRVSASASVWRSTTVEEKTKQEELERIWFRLVENLVRDFDAAMEPRIREYFAGYLP